MAIDQAFQNEDNAKQLHEYLVKHIATENYKAVLLAVQKSTLKTPQPWKSEKGREIWKFEEEQDGLFIQIETKDTPNGSLFRQLHFLPLDKKRTLLSKEPFILDPSIFQLLPPLYN